MRAEVTTDRALVVRVRPATAADEPFLHRLYADRRGPELASLGWTAEQCAAFVDLQFQAQQDGYGGSFPAADSWIVLVDDAPAGRILIDRRPDEHLVVDMVVLTGWRGRGIGTALMSEVLDDARRAAVPVRLTVAVNEPHLVQWYGGLGFVVVAERDISLVMRWSPHPPTVGEG